MACNEKKVIRVGSRKSELALIQTKYVISRLREFHPDKIFEIHTMTTIGDRVLNISLPKIGEKSLFTRDLEDALCNGDLDLVVHSLKDLPILLPSGMVIGAVLEREDPRDAVVLREQYKDHTLSSLPPGSVIGTSSLRRTAQLRKNYPHLNVCDIRGNLNTRLQKLDADDSKFAGIVLAQAGLVRMGWQKRISQVLETLYAVGQGALAVECCASNTEVLRMLENIMCLNTTCSILAERSYLKTLGGGCSAPVAVYSKLTGNVKDSNSKHSATLQLKGAVWSLDGSIEIREDLADILHIENGNELKDTDINANGADDDDEQPPEKKSRVEDANAPPIVSDDDNFDAITKSYGTSKLIEKHIGLSKQCPVIANLSSSNSLETDPLPINTGEDFMGQCPFKNDWEKIVANIDKCPIRHKVALFDNNGNDKHKEKDDNPPPENKITESQADFSNNDVMAKKAQSADAAHYKCPFLRKRTQSATSSDYINEDQHTAKLKTDVISNKLTESIESLCGLHQPAAYLHKDLFERCSELGERLAKQLIKKGALAVMKAAQNEIHQSKP